MIEEMTNELLTMLHRLALAAENLGHCEGGQDGRERLDEITDEAYKLIKKCKEWN